MNVKKIKLQQLFNKQRKLNSQIQQLQSDIEHQETDFPFLL